jgi:transcriptional regulator with XRE-family HTH domain
MRDASHDQATLGRALRALRKGAGIELQDLAQRLGVHRTYVSQVENGHRGVRWHTVRRFLDALDVNLHQLADAITEVERQNPSSKPDR